MHRIGRDDRPGDADAVQQQGEHGNLVRLGSHIHLAQHRAVGVIEDGQQVHAGLPGAVRAAQRLTVHRNDLPPFRP